MDEQIQQASQRLGRSLSANGLLITAAESCTGGLIAKCLTDIEGSSSWFEQAWVTYSNKAKSEMLGVPDALIQAHGAVSEAVVEAMASGALQRSGASLAVAVSGIAGPGGGTSAKPVGTVWIAWACGSSALHHEAVAKAMNEQPDNHTSAHLSTESKLIASDNNTQDAIRVITRLYRFDGDRELVRKQAALEVILVSGSLLGA